MKIYKRFLDEQRSLTQPVRGMNPSGVRFPTAAGQRVPRGTAEGAVDRIGSATTRAQQYRIQQIDNRRQQATRQKDLKQSQLEFKRRAHHAALNTAKGKVEDAFRTMMLRPTGTGTAGAKKAIMAGSGAGAGAALAKGYQSGTDSLAGALGQVPGLPGPQPAKFTDPVLGLQFGGREAQGHYAKAIAQSLPVVGPTVATLTGDTAAGTARGAKQLTGRELKALINTPFGRRKAAEAATMTGLNVGGEAVAGMGGVLGKIGYDSLEGVTKENYPKIAKAAGDLAAKTGSGYDVPNIVTGTTKIVSNIGKEVSKNKDSYIDNIKDKLSSLFQRNNK